MPPNMVCFPLPTQSPKRVALLAVVTIERLERRMCGDENSVKRRSADEWGSRHPRRRVGGFEWTSQEQSVCGSGKEKKVGV